MDLEQEQAGRMLGPVQIRRLAKSLAVTPTKKLGQNFVHDAGTVRKIADLAGVGKQDLVLEVGPGLGSLTLALLETGARVVAVEIDGRLAAALPETVAEMAPAWQGRLTVVNQDALTLDAAALTEGGTLVTAAAPTALVANLPYNVAVPVLLNVLAALESIRSGVVMVQKEVADRLTASPGSRVYGAPTVKLAWYGKARSAGVVGRKVFWPEPNVESALVRFVVDEEPRGPLELRNATFAVVDATFGQRRKMLRSSLKELLRSGSGESDAGVETILQASNVAGTERPEDLSVEQFVAISKAALDAGWRP